MRRLRRSICGLVLAGACALPGAAEAAAPAWFSYTRAAEYGVKTTSVRVPMRDGTKLGCYLSVPARGGKPAPGAFPGIVYEVTPYDVLSLIYVSHGEWLARRGYQALLCNVRGTGRSGGFFPHNNQPVEWQDSYDIVEWLAAHPGSNGRIGQEGESYGGMTSYQAAVARPPHLVAVAPQQAPTDLYEDDVYPGGIKRTPLSSDWWPLAASATTFGRVPFTRVWGAWFRHPRHDAFWDGIAIGPKLDRVEVPVLAVGGWDDPLFRRGSLRNYEELVRAGHGSKTWLIYGPWEHSTVVDWPSCLGTPVCVKHERLPTGVLLAWFDHWLKELPDAPLPSARVTTYEGPWGSAGRGWEEHAAWPPADAEAVDLPLRADGALGGDAGAAGTASFTQRPTDGLRGETERVEFATAPLAADRVLAGDIELTLRARYSAGDANLHAVLLERRADGSVRRVNDGWLRVSHRESSATPSRVRAGEDVTLKMEIWPVHRRVPAGAQLVLRVSGGSVTHGVPQPRPVRTDVVTGAGGSSLRLTVRGGGL
ncbi:MAG: CocE/NonD family hydrolase [Solirubrobacteraceae bacterium]|nr:CocE/NonD family hydrolase [Solirubrobacteraceae bacterium]